MSKIENCDAGGKQNVSVGDLSEKISGEVRDNDRRCPITGLQVILVIEDGEYFCVLPNGVNCGRWNEDPHDPDRFDKYIGA